MSMPSRAARSVINSVCGALNLILNRDKGKVGHELDNVTRRKVASGIRHIRLLVEHTDNLFKQGAHCMIIKRLQLFGAILIQDGLIAEVYTRIDKLLDK